MEIVEQLKQIQSRTKSLSENRDKILRELGSEERKLKDAVTKLEELGVKDVETKSDEEIEAMISDLEKQLSEQMARITKEVENGEALVSKFNSIK
jgi:predicted component of type VI protein secretion system